MTRKMPLLLPFLFPFLVGCTGDAAAVQTKEAPAANAAPAHPQGAGYVPTGFYYLADGTDGITIRKEGSAETYVLQPRAFASVRHVKRTKLETTALAEGDYTELCLTFDAEGTRDLAEGTGNSAHPKIAVVIAGKLLYVVDNTARIKTGVMCVGLPGYSAPEIDRMKLAVDEKR